MLTMVTVAGFGARRLVSTGADALVWGAVAGGLAMTSAFLAALMLCQVLPPNWLSLEAACARVQAVMMLAPLGGALLTAGMWRRSRRRWSRRASTLVAIT